jgi:hypothetical protein
VGTSNPTVTGARNAVGTTHSTVTGSSNAVGTSTTSELYVYQLRIIALYWAHCVLTSVAGCVFSDYVVFFLSCM